jgi:hypothetical protein
MGGRSNGNVGGKDRGRGGSGQGRGSAASSGAPKPAWHCKWCIGSNGPWRNSGGLGECGKCGLPKGQCYKAPPNSGSVANPATNLAQRSGAAELSSPERKELEELRRAAKGKAWGKTGGKGAEVADVPAGAPVPLTLAEKRQMQTKAQQAWKQLRDLQDSGVVSLGEAMVHFPSFPEAEIEPTWENKVQKAKNLYNKAWSKLKTAKSQATTAVQSVADLRLALQKAIDEEKVAGEAQIAATLTFNEAAVALRAAEDGRGGEASEDGDGSDGSSKRRRGTSKPDIPEEEVRLWDQFKAALGARVRLSTSNGESVPDFTELSRTLAAGLGELLAKQIAEESSVPCRVDDGGDNGHVEALDPCGDDFDSCLGGGQSEQMEADLNLLDSRRKGMGKAGSRGQHGPQPYT